MRTPRNEGLSASTARTQRRDGRDGPERRCILTRTTGSRAGLLRLALSPDGLVLPDVLARAPGRGAWVGVSRAALEQALADGTLRRTLARAFHGVRLDIPDDLPARAQAAFERALVERLGLELRAGHLLLGTQRIDRAAREGRVFALYHAADAAPDGAAKLDQAWRVGSDAEGSGQTGARLPLDRAALSVALGRENAVHLALVDAGAADRVAGLLARMTEFCGAGGAARDTVTPAHGTGAAAAAGGQPDGLKDRAGL
ncbi:DUF448 domain-containing protein [Erythrobacteraceae bacterium CFH 75059]|uniref:DUF448 domain-containing protein n=1 Tax=Qipengyuania thermophila TaxID=2509361 RepID=UPI001021652F|nr:DUF448 domain-containing protein [Qipengyuania thermophila]TCD01858.1 DUF448 domain-containing protein [Erythrobacteraceae bacterium CFH 75059]